MVDVVVAFSQIGLKKNPSDNIDTGRIPPIVFSEKLPENFHVEYTPLIHRFPAMLQYKPFKVEREITNIYLKTVMIQRRYNDRLNPPDTQICSGCNSPLYFFMRFFPCQHRNPQDSIVAGARL